MDGSRILLGGDSVGGNLALTVALLLRESTARPSRASWRAIRFATSRLDTPSYHSYGAAAMALRWSR